MRGDQPAPDSLSGQAHSISLIDDLRDAPVTIFPLIAVALLIAWLPASAAYSPSVFCAGALAVLILVVATIAQRVERAAANRARTVAIGAALAFTAWNYASIAWSEDAGTAFDGANRTALYAALFVLFALTPWTPRVVYLALGAYATGVVVIGIVDYANAVTSSHPENDFISGRVISPAGYENASAALLVTATIVAVVVASRAAVHPAVRGSMFAVATAGADLAILAQSRGSVLGAAVATPILLLFAANRGRLLAALGLVALSVAIAAPALLGVYTASDRGFRAFDAAVHHSLRMIGVSVGASVVATLLWLLAARFLPRQESIGRAADRAVLVLVCVALCVPFGILVVRPHTATHALSAAWHSFAHAGSPTGASTRFSSLGSGRYDFYRVTLREIRNHPVLGVGSDNFAVDYLRSRRTDQEPLYPHSDLLRIPAQTGIVGSLLALLFAGAFLVALRGSWRSARTATLALGAPIAYWLAQSSFDWLWEVAGVTAPIAACAGAVFSLRSDAASPRPLRRATRLTAVAVAVVLAVPLGADWLSGRQVDAALAHWRADPTAAVDRLHSAASLNPFSDRPNLFAAAIAAQSGDRRTMGVELARAESRNPRNWYTHLLLAVLAADRGSWREAQRQIADAARLDPKEPTIADVRRAVRLHRKPRLTALEAVFLDRAATRVRSGVTRSPASSARQRP